MNDSWFVWLNCFKYLSSFVNLFLPTAYVICHDKKSVYLKCLFFNSTLKNSFQVISQAALYGLKLRFRPIEKTIGCFNGQQKYYFIYRTDLIVASRFQVDFNLILCIN